MPKQTVSTYDISFLISTLSILPEASFMRFRWDENVFKKVELRINRIALIFSIAYEKNAWNSCYATLALLYCFVIAVLYWRRFQIPSLLDDCLLYT